MTTHNSKKLLSSISKMLFESSLFGLYNGSISLKRDHNCFIINKRDCFFASITPDMFYELSIEEKNYNWRLGSINSNLHLDIYNNFHEAKYIISAMPPNVSALSFLTDEIVPIDYFGIKHFKNIKVHILDDLMNWHENASSSIINYFKNSEHNIVVVRGIGIYAYGRDMDELVEKISVLEDSARLLLKTKHYQAKS